MSAIAALLLLIAATSAEATPPPVGSGVIAAAAALNQTDDATPPPQPADSAVGDAAATPIPRPLLTPGNLLILAVGFFCAWLFFKMRGYRLDGTHGAAAPPQRPVTFDQVIGIGLFIGAIIFAQIGLHAGVNTLGIDLQQPLDLRDTALLALSRYTGEAIIIAFFAVMLLRAVKPQPDRRFGFVTSVLAGAGALLLFWPIVASVAWLINLLVHQFRGTLPDPIAHETLVMLLEADRTVWFFITAGIALIIAPIFEEVLYRGVLQETMIRLELPRWYAIVATSAIFAVMHIAAAPSPDARPGMLAALFVLSLGFGWVYEKTGRLAAPIAMHVLFNAGNLALAMLAA